MVIRLDKVRDEPFRWHETLEIDIDELERPEILALGSVEWGGEVTYAAPAFHVHADYRFELTQACSRCLRPVVMPVAGSCDLLVSVGAASAASGEHQLHEEDLGQVTVPDERLDTRSLLVEQLQLEVPMHPLCRPDCRGLCPHCGAELDAGPCGCQTSAGDPRWEALASLRDKLPSS